MTHTIILKCTKCGGYILSAESQKTKLCPYCGSKVIIQKAQHIASGDTAFEASELLRKLKSERGFDQSPQRT